MAVNTLEISVLSEWQAAPADAAMVSSSDRRVLASIF